MVIIIVSAGTLLALGAVLAAGLTVLAIVGVGLLAVLAVAAYLVGDPGAALIVLLAASFLVMLQTAPGRRVGAAIRTTLEWAGVALIVLGAVFAVYWAVLEAFRLLLRAIS